MSASDLLSRAEALYEAGRKRVSGRPAWADLNPSDPYDMGMRDVAIRQAEASESATDPIAAAQIVFLIALNEGRKPAGINLGLDWNAMSREERNAAREHGRIQNAARQRAKKAGRAVWSGGQWYITSTGRQWLATPTAPEAAA